MHDLHSITFLTPAQWGILKGWDPSTASYVFAGNEHARIAVCSCGWDLLAWHGPVLVRAAAEHVRSSGLSSVA